MVRALSSAQGPDSWDTWDLSRPVGAFNEHRRPSFTGGDLR